MGQLVKEHLRARRFADAEKAALTALEGLQSWKPPKIEYGKRADRWIGRNLYIPIEVAARDLPHRCRLAADAANEGFHVVFGAPWNLSAHGYRDLPPGIVLLKSLNAVDARHAVIANNAGHQVAVMSEELIACVPNRDLYDVEIHPIAMALADLVLLHSDAALATVLDLYPDYHAKLVVTGNPRADADEPMLPIGDEIVVCMMSGTVNGWSNIDDYLASVGHTMGKKYDGTMYRRVSDLIKHECRSLPLVLDTIDLLKEHFGDRVRVRPHPVEDPLTFGFAHDPAPFVERLRSAACIVFVSGCGTGLEAALYDVPSVRLGHGGDGQSRILGLSAENPKAALDAVMRALCGEQITMPESMVKRPNTVMHELGKLYEARRGSEDMHVDPIASIAHHRPAQFMPTPFQKNKFPDQSSSTIERFCGRAPRTIGWNMWALTP